MTFLTDGNKNGIWGTNVWVIDVSPKKILIEYGKKIKIKICG